MLLSLELRFQDPGSRPERACSEGRDFVAPPGALDDRGEEGQGGGRGREESEPVDGFEFGSRTQFRESPTPRIGMRPTRFRVRFQGRGRNEEPQRQHHAAAAAESHLLRNDQRKDLRWRHPASRVRDDQRRELPRGE